MAYTHAKISEAVPPFFVMPMPYNAKGEGPETDPTKAIGTKYEVWCQLLLSWASFDNSWDAEAKARRLNQEWECRKLMAMKIAVELPCDDV